jgi:hypothetical protein
MERYLAEVTARLSGPPRALSGIVAELRVSWTASSASSNEASIR